MVEWVGGWVGEEGAIEAGLKTMWANKRLNSVVVDETITAPPAASPSGASLLILTTGVRPIAAGARGAQTRATGTFAMKFIQGCISVGCRERSAAYSLSFSDVTSARAVLAACTLPALAVDRRYTMRHMSQNARTFHSCSL